MSALHLGVDANNLLHDRRGIGRYARALITRWLQLPANELRIALLVPHLFPHLARKRLAAVLGVDDVPTFQRARAARLALDAVWYPWSGMTWTAPLCSIATVHDVWPFAAPAQDRRKRHNEQTPFLTTARCADAIITDSQFSKTEIVRYLGVSAEKISVVPLGVDPPPAITGARPLLDGATSYVLFVGESEERKDLHTLKRAWALLPERLRTTTGLVIVGKPERAQRRIGTIATREPLVLRFEPADGINLIVTGEIPDDVLARLYAGASVFVFPSKYEGFGLPVLEAMAHGVPVVASEAASIPEAGGGAARYFTAGDAPALAAALGDVLSDASLAARLSAAGRERAASMSWDRCAARTLAVLRASARSRKTPA